MSPVYDKANRTSIAQGVPGIKLLIYKEKSKHSRQMYMFHTFMNA
jgi:hypothetical protein